ncbi:MAG: patatin-like phospholipase family protein [Pseudonocardia sp.]
MPGILITVAGVAMVFSGGGAPAAYFGAGVVRAVEEAGLAPRIFSGVSAGAINAAALAVGLDAAGLATMWRGIRWSDVARWRTDVYRLPKVENMLRGAPHLLDWALGSVGWTALLDNSPARAALRERLGGPELPIAHGRTLVVSAVDVRTGEVLRFGSRPASRPDSAILPGRLTVEHLLASAAVPVVFPPVEIGERLLVDAGTVANTPLAPVMDYEPDAVVVVSGSGGTRPAPAPASLGETIGLLVDNLAHFALRADLEHAATVNELARAGATDRRDVPMVLVEPRRLAFSAGSFFRFTQADADRIMGYGHERGTEALATWMRAEVDGGFVDAP